MHKFIFVSFWRQKYEFGKFSADKRIDAKTTFDIYGDLPLSGIERLRNSHGASCKGKKYALFHEILAFNCVAHNL